MKKYLALLVLCLFVMPAFGAGRSMVGNVRPGGVGAVRNAAPARSGTTTTSATATAQQNTAATTTADPAADAAKAAAKTAYDQARMACLSNNIGIGNTFVWAARNSNTANYATMVEDTENPNNNVCFVLVGMRSEDPRVNTSDIQPRYFEWGQNITCGSWVDEEKLRERILDAKKKARVWGTIGASVGGAGLGVGMMEAFGNKLLAKSDSLKGLQGQKAYEEGSAEWYRVKANELKQKNPSEYQKFKDDIEELRETCRVSNSDARCEQEPYKSLRELDL